MVAGGGDPEGPPEHVPEGYQPRPLAHATLWSAGEVEQIPEWVDAALSQVSACLGLGLDRVVHVVVYASTADAHAALGRRVPAGALLAPLHTPQHALIALHAPHLDPGNRDRARMMRHLCHEASHVYLSAHSGSTKRLGDGGVGMRVRPWLDEGLAECVSAVASDQPGVIERAQARACGPWPGAEWLDATLSELSSPDRPLAFAHATTQIWRRICSGSLPLVFRCVAEHGRLPTLRAVASLKRA